MRTFEAGVTEPIFPFNVRWTRQFIEAESATLAETHFEEKGFYRNLVVREVEHSEGVSWEA